MVPKPPPGTHIHLGSCMQVYLHSEAALEASVSGLPQEVKVMSGQNIYFSCSMLSFLHPPDGLLIPWASELNEMMTPEHALILCFLASHEHDQA